MEASEEILLNSLANSGVPIPAGVSSVGDLTPSTLFSLCSHALRLIHGPRHASTFPASLPEDSTPDRVKICEDIADAFNNLGFRPALGLHKFLYPSMEDLYNLVRFLVGRMPESSSSSAKDNKPSDVVDSVQSEEILSKLKHVRLKNDVKTTVEEADPTLQDSSRCSGADHHSDPAGGVESSRKSAFGDQDGSQNHEEVLEKLMAGKYSELQLPNEELLWVLKEAVKMLFDGQHPVEFYVEELNKQVEAKRYKLKELESKWDAIEEPLQEKKGNLEQSMFTCHPEPSGDLTRMKEIQMETESILAQIKRREEEILKLSSDVKKQPKLAPRRSYVERINEITKNSRKQDNDLQRILKDTRDLQLESNTIQERLNRTYAIVDETVFREAKNDHVAQQAYVLLRNIHESFERVAEKILAADRSRRDAADLEAKLTIISARSLNTVKLQADLEAIRKENDLLEQQLQ